MLTCACFICWLFQCTHLTYMYLLLLYLIVSVLLSSLYVLFMLHTALVVQIYMQLKRALGFHDTVLFDNRPKLCNVFIVNEIGHFKVYSSCMLNFFCMCTRNSYWYKQPPRAFASLILEGRWKGYVFSNFHLSRNCKICPLRVGLQLAFDLSYSKQPDMQHSIL